MSYERLLREHDRIDQALLQLQRLTRAAVPDVPAVSAALSHLAGELTYHLAHEDSFIYPRMIESRIGQVASIARQFVDEFESLTTDYKVYLREWLPDCIAGDWDGFREETETKDAQHRTRDHAENSVLYSAALNHG